jgi:hypothetical protein
VAWAVWTIKPTLNRNDEGPEEIPGLLSCAEAGKLQRGRRDQSRSLLGKTMASDDKKIRTNPVQKNEVSQKKKDEAAPDNKSTSGAGLSKIEGGEKAADAPAGYSRGEGQKPVSKAYKENWNAIYAKKKKR